MAVQQNPVDLASPDITLRLIISNCHESHGMPDTVGLPASQELMQVQITTAPSDLATFLLPSDPKCP